MQSLSGRSYKKRIIEVAAAIAIVLFLGLITAPTAVYSLFIATNTVSASVTIPNSCIPQVSNSAIAFASAAPGGSDPDENAVLVNNLGTSTSNVWVQGTSWAYLSNTFNVDNTLWNPSFSSASPPAGNTLSGSATDTHIVTPANLINQGVGGNNIFFGVNVPSNTITGTYSQTITISDSC